MDFEKIIRSQAFYIEPEDNDIVYVRASKLGEYIKSIVEESFPVDKPVGVPKPNTNCEQDAELGKKVKDKIGKLETAEVGAEMIMMCAHVLVKVMAETNSGTAKWTIEGFSIKDKLYGDYEIKIKHLASKP